MFHRINRVLDAIKLLSNKDDSVVVTFHGQSIPFKPIAHTNIRGKLEAIQRRLLHKGDKRTLNMSTAVINFSLRAASLLMTALDSSKTSMKEQSRISFVTLSTSSIILSGHLVRYVSQIT